MKRMIVAGMLALAIALSSGLAMAHDVQGRVQTIELMQRVLTLEDGTSFYWTEDITITQQLQSGDLVRATYEERDGQYVLIALEVVQ